MMDVAYDHVQEASLSPTTTNDKQPSTSDDASSSSTTHPQSPTLNAEFNSAFRAVQASPWGSALGSWFSTARQQGETLYQDLQKEASGAQEQATRGFSSLRETVTERTRKLSLSGAPAAAGAVPGEEGVPSIGVTGAEEGGKTKEGGKAEKPESLPADVVKEAGSMLASLRKTAAAKLKDLQRAEDAADEALLKFGGNVRDFLREAVVISAPTDADTGKPRGTDAAGNEVLFETQEPGTGKKVFHSTRLDAQLHAIHTRASSFTADPAAGEAWETWTRDFDAEARTEEIGKDLERYEELRRAMEKLVPETVEYRAFWMRYYFLRKAVEEDEKKRREVLKGATTDPKEEVSWSDDESDNESSSAPKPTNPAASSTTTLSAPTPAKPATDPDTATLKPTKSPRRSHEDESKSVADSDASYDLVSGATSRGQGSPREEKKESAGSVAAVRGKGKDGKGEASDEDDDWE